MPFTPPPLSSHEGPDPTYSFTPPPLSSHQGPDPNFTPPPPIEDKASGPVKYGPGHHIWDDPDMGSPEPSMQPGLPGHPGVDIATGLGQIGSGEFSKGAHNVLSGAAKIGSVALPSAAFTAPLATVGGLVGSGAGGLIGKFGSKAIFNASEDQSNLAGDAMAMLAGPLGAKLVEHLGLKAAIGFANSALGTSAKYRQFGTDPGKAVLSETSGTGLADISKSAADRINALKPVKQRIVENSPPVALTKARALIAAKKAYAAQTGDSALDTELGPMARTLAGNTVTGESYPDTVPAGQALDILRGFGNQHPKFVEGRTTTGNDAAKGAWGQLRNDIRENAPGSEQLDTRMKDLIPARDLALRSNNNAGAVQTGINRATRPTGGMAPALMGLHEGGPLGGMATMAAQEALGQPRVKMGIARALYRGARGERLDVPDMPPPNPPPTIRGLLGPGPIVTPPPKVFTPWNGDFTTPEGEGSFVRGTPAHQPFRVGFPENAPRQLGPGTTNGPNLSPDIGSRHGDLTGGRTRNLKMPSMDSLDEANLRGTQPTPATAPPSVSGNQAQRRAGSAPPATGVPEGVSRGQDAREALSMKLTGKSFRELSNPDRMAVDQHIARTRAQYDPLDLQQFIDVEPNQ